MSQVGYDEINLNQLMSMLKRRRKTILLITFLVFFAYLFFILAQPNKYTASALLSIGKIDEVPIEYILDIINFNNFDATKEVQLKQIGSYLQINTSDVSQDMASQILKKQVDLILDKHARMIEQNIHPKIITSKEAKKLQDKLRDELTTLKNKEKDSAKNPLFADAQIVLLINVPSPNIVPTRVEAVKTELESRKSKMLNLFLSSILGLFLGIAWAYTSESLKKSTGTSISYFMLHEVVFEEAR